MTKKIKIYLDTSVISALFDDKNPERQDLTKRFFQQTETFAVYVSEVVLTEIDNVRNTQLKEKLRHIVKIKTRRIVNMVNFSHGRPDLKIATPAELI